VDAILLSHTTTLMLRSASVDDVTHLYAMLSDTVTGPETRGLRPFDRLDAYCVHRTYQQPGIGRPAQRSDGPARERQSTAPSP
jgi:hypothetical protein